MMLMRYIAIVIILFSLISLVGAKECFQESANQSSITDTPNCGLKYDGNYGGDENVYQNLLTLGVQGYYLNYTAWHDGNYSTLSVIVQNKPVYVNYSIPDNTTGAKWSIDVPNGESGNYTLPVDCLNNIFSNILQIEITNDYDWTSNVSGPGLFHASCWDYHSSSWYEFWTEKTANVWLYEESMWWTIPSDDVVNTNTSFISDGTKSTLKLTVGLLSVALFIITSLWVYRLVDRNEISLKQVLKIFVYLMIGLLLLQLIAAIIIRL